jgi:outer membrane receptor protein involved in Fe transport
MRQGPHRCFVPDAQGVSPSRRADRFSRSGTPPPPMLLIDALGVPKMKKTMISLLALAAALPAYAQDYDQPPETNTGDEIIVTASRSGEGVKADQLGGSVTVIDDEALNQRNTRIVSDVLRDVPGVAVNRLGAVGGQTQIRIRGTEGNHVLVLIDGIEAADPYQGEYDFGTLLADADARIEVLRGQQSALYGSDAIGGVIHYMTLSGAEAPASAHGWKAVRSARSTAPRARRASAARSITPSRARLTSPTARRPHAVASATSARTAPGSAANSTGGRRTLSS